MSENKKDVPKLRFPGFTDTWEQRKLGEVANFRRGSFPQPYGNVEWYDGEGAMPFVQVVDITDNLVLVSDTKQKISKLAQPKSIFVPKGKVVVTLQGSIGRVAIAQYDCFVDRTLLIFESYNELIHETFWAYTIQLKFDIEKEKAPGGTIKTITKEALSNFVISLPRFEEQKVIGGFFLQLDNLITFHQRKLDNVKNLKTGLLQKMFPKDGEEIPEIRFPGFTDAWEQRGFEQMLDNREGIRRGPFGSALTKDIFVEDSDYVVYEQQNAIYDTYETRYKISKSKFEELKKFSLKPNDFIMSGAGTIGRISRVPHNIKQGVFNQALIRFRINNEVTNPEYFIQFIRGDYMQRKLTGANPGSAITNLVPMSEVKKWRILVPSIKEQQQIGSFFADLDHLITLHQRKLDRLQQLKKALLQNMFV